MLHYSIYKGKKELNFSVSEATILVVKYKTFTNFSGISSPQANVKYVKLIKGILEIYL